MRLFISLAAGITTGNLIAVPLAAVWLFSILFITVLLQINRNYRYKHSVLFGTTACLLYYIIGIVIINMYNRRPVFHDRGIYSSTVMEIPVEKSNSVQTLLKLHFIIDDDRTVRSDEKILALFEKSERSLNIQPGDRVVFNRAPQLVSVRNNPYEFNYKKYLARKRIYRQLYIPDGEWAVYASKLSFEPVVMAERIRMALLNRYRQSGLAINHQNVIAALTLGYKGGLDPETRQVFASAGAMHVLAVSGLHVGIIFMVFSFCLGFLKINRPGRIALLFISLGSLWFFALLTGLSPSVSRAALMLTFVVAGQNLKRRANIYNTLAASALFLLIINPNNLFDAGFQFSYSAVFGIVFIQPRIERLITFKFRVLKYLWALLSVSVAAQVTTFPLSVYYFDQVPVWFWITNLFIIPVVTIVVPFGFMLLTFQWCPVIFRFLSLLLDKLFEVIFGFLKLIEQLPVSVIQISMSEEEIFFLICLLLFLFFLIKTKKAFYVKAVLFSLFMIVAISLAMKAARLNRREIIVYNQREDIVVHLITGNQNYIISSGKIELTGYSYEMAMRTAMKLKLEKPLLLTADQKYKDDHICMINNTLSFEGRIICFLNKTLSLPGNMLPDIIISPLKKCPLQLISSKSSVTLVTKMRIKENLPENIQIHHLEDRGAYREKW